MKWWRYYFKLTIHLSHGIHEIFRVLKTNKAIALGLLGVPVSDHFGLEK